MGFRKFTQCSAQASHHVLLLLHTMYCSCFIPCTALYPTYILCTLCNPKP